MIKYSIENNVGPSPWFTGWYIVSIEYMPAVKMSVFAFCDQFKVIPAIVKTIVVDVVNLHPGGCLGDQSVHPDQNVGFTDPFSECCIAVFTT